MVLGQSKTPDGWGSVGDGLWRPEAILFPAGCGYALPCKVHRMLSYVSLGTYVKIRIRTFVYWPAKYVGT